MRPSHSRLEHKTHWWLVRGLFGQELQQASRSQEQSLVTARMKTGDFNHKEINSANNLRGLGGRALPIPASAGPQFHPTPAQTPDTETAR